MPLLLTQPFIYTCLPQPPQITHLSGFKNSKKYPSCLLSTCRFVRFARRRWCCDWKQTMMKSRLLVPLVRVLSQAHRSLMISNYPVVVISIGEFI